MEEAGIRVIDWQIRDVMVGVLHNAKQLDANLAHRFYHMPAKLLAAQPEAVRYIALYQSKRHFSGRDAGVRFYGAVADFRVLPRGEIVEIPTRNQDEPYYRFDIVRWLPLERLIRAGGIAPGVCMFTNLPLLHSSRVFPELYIRTEEQYVLYSRLRSASARTLRDGGCERIPAAVGHTVMVAGWTIGIYSPDGGYEQRDLREFYVEPFGFLQRMQAVCQGNV